MANEIMDELFEDDGRGGPGEALKPPRPRPPKDLTNDMIRKGFDDIKRLVTRPQPATRSTKSYQTGQAVGVKEATMDRLLRKIDQMVDIVRVVDVSAKMSKERGPAPRKINENLPVTRALQDIAKYGLNQVNQLDRIIQLLKEQGNGGGGGGMLDDLMDMGSDRKKKGSGKKVDTTKKAGRGAGRSRMGRAGKAAGLGLLAGGAAYGLSKLFGADDDIAEDVGAVTGVATTAGSYFRSGKPSVATTVAEGAKGIQPVAEGATKGIGLAGKGASALETGSKVLGKVAVPLAVGMAGFDAYQTEHDDTLSRSEKNVKHAGTGGGLAGGLSGAAAGAIVGSVVPVVGTAIGALVGGIAGSFGGKWLGETSAKALVDQMAVNTDEQKAVASAQADANKQSALDAKSAAVATKILSDNTTAQLDSVEAQKKLIDPMSKLADPSWSDNLRNSMAGAVSRVAKFVGDSVKSGGQAVSSGAAKVAEVTKGTVVEGAGKAVANAGNAVGAVTSYAGEAVTKGGGVLSEKIGKNFRNQNHSFAGIKGGAGMEKNGSYTTDEANTIRSLKTNNMNTSANLKNGMPPEIRDKIIAQAIAQGQDPKLALSIVAMESGGNANAVSSTGAIGLNQFTGKTATGVGITDRFDVDQNIAGGVKLTNQNSAALKKAGLAVTPENVYMMHQLGPKAAIETITGARDGKTKSQMSASTQDAMNKNYGANSATAADYLASNKKALADRYNNVVKGGDEAIAKATDPKAAKGGKAVAAVPSAAAAADKTTAAAPANSATAALTKPADPASKFAATVATKDVAKDDKAVVATKDVAKDDKAVVATKDAKATPIATASGAAVPTPPATDQPIRVANVTTTPVASKVAPEMMAPARQSYTEPVADSVGNYEPPMTAQSVATAIRASAPPERPTTAVAEGGSASTSSPPLQLDSIPIVLDDIGLVIFNMPQLS